MDDRSSGFGRHLGLTVTHGLDLEQDLKLFYCEFQKYEVMTMSVAGGQPKKHANPSDKATKHIERTFLISDFYQYKFMFLRDRLTLRSDPHIFIKKPRLEHDFSANLIGNEFGQFLD